MPNLPSPTSGTFSRSVFVRQKVLFACILLIVLTKNIGLGVFQQLEEILLLPSHERGQTAAVEVGWPFAALSTEAFTTNVVWANAYGETITPGAGLAYLAIDFCVSAIVCIATTHCLSQMIQKCSWRLNIRTILAIIPVWASILVYERERHWYQDGVGALAGSVFQFVDAFLLVFAVFTWYWVIGIVGAAIHRINPQASP